MTSHFSSALLFLTLFSFSAHSQLNNVDKTFYRSFESVSFRVDDNGKVEASSDKSIDFHQRSSSEESIINYNSYSDIYKDKYFTLRYKVEIENGQCIFKEKEVEGEFKPYFIQGKNGIKYFRNCNSEFMINKNAGNNFTSSDDVKVVYKGEVDITTSFGKIKSSQYNFYNQGWVYIRFFSEEFGHVASLTYAPNSLLKEINSHLSESQIEKKYAALLERENGYLLNAAILSDYYQVDNKADKKSNKVEVNAFFNNLNQNGLKASNIASDVLFKKTGMATMYRIKNIVANPEILNRASLSITDEIKEYYGYDGENLIELDSYKALESVFFSIYTDVFKNDIERCGKKVDLSSGFKVERVLPSFGYRFRTEFGKDCSAELEISNQTKLIYFKN